MPRKARISSNGIRSRVSTITCPLKGRYVYRAYEAGGQRAVILLYSRALDFHPQKIN